MPSSDIFARIDASKSTAAKNAAEAEENASAGKGYRLVVDQPVEVDEMDELRLPEEFVEGMILKLLVQHGALDEQRLAFHLKISKKIIQKLCAEMSRKKWIGPKSSDPRFWTTGTEGKIRAEEANQVTRYQGPLPVLEEDYVRLMREQVKKPLSFGQSDIEAAYSRMIIYDTEFMDRIGPAVRSQRSILIYGAPGNGKTIMGKALTNLMQDDLIIPYAVFSNGQIVRVFDPQIHKPVFEEKYEDFDMEKVNAVRYDRRWVVIKVPYVEVATEFTLEGFEPSFNPYGRFYDMPYHVKANGGVFFIDDFGRQHGTPEEYLNRLITPLQMKEDILRLKATGGQFRVPFFCIPLFSTNLTLERIGDEAFLRRFKYKILARSPAFDDFKRIFQFECERNGFPYTEDIWNYVRSKYKDGNPPLRASHANDLLSKIQDYCTFHDKPLDLTRELLDMAWTLNFSPSQENWAFGMAEKK